MSSEDQYVVEYLSGKENGVRAWEPKDRREDAVVNLSKAHKFSKTEADEKYGGDSDYQIYALTDVLRGSAGSLDICVIQEGEEEDEDDEDEEAETVAAPAAEQITIKINTDFLYSSPYFESIYAERNKLYEEMAARFYLPFIKEEK